MKEGQTEIYYLAGDNRSVVEASPHLEAFAERGYEVLYLLDPIDELMVQSLHEHDGKRLRSVAEAEATLGSEEEKKTAREELERRQGEYRELLASLQGRLDAWVREVRLSSQLKTQPSRLVTSEGDLSPHLERILRQTDSGFEMPETPAHPRAQPVPPGGREAARPLRRGEARSQDRGLRLSAAELRAPRGGHRASRSGALQQAARGLDGARSLTYYVDNFERVVDTVTARYGDLLTERERALGDELEPLSLGARCLYVRLVSRVGPYFRRHDLHYEEIADLEGAIAELAAAGFLDPAPEAEPAALLPHLLRAEIDGIRRDLRSRPTWRRVRRRRGTRPPRQGGPDRRAGRDLRPGNAPRRDPRPRSAARAAAPARGRALPPPLLRQPAPGPERAGPRRSRRLSLRELRAAPRSAPLPHPRRDRRRASRCATCASRRAARSKRATAAARGRSRRRSPAAIRPGTRRRDRSPTPCCSRWRRCSSAAALARIRRAMESPERSSSTPPPPRRRRASAARASRRAWDASGARSRSAARSRWRRATRANDCSRRASSSACGAASARCRRHAAAIAARIRLVLPPDRERAVEDLALEHYAARGQERLSRRELVVARALRARLLGRDVRAGRRRVRARLPGRPTRSRGAGVPRAPGDRDRRAPGRDRRGGRARRRASSPPGTRSRACAIVSSPGRPPCASASSSRSRTSPAAISPPSSIG